jgi:hypothetical protein
LVLADQTGPESPLYQDHQSFLSSVGAIIFLGTPHRGSIFPSVAQWKIWLGKLGNIEACEDLLKILHLESHLLSYLQHEFERAGKKKPLDRLEICCFYETKQQHIGPWNLGYVVSEASACLDGAEKCSLETDHMGMNKFLPQDKNYDTFSKFLVSATRSSGPNVSRRFNARQYNSISASQELKELKQWLAPSTGPQKRQLEARYADQQRTVSTSATCGWITQVDLFHQWHEGFSPNNVLWIHGKPGSGKSVLAAYLVKLLRDETPFGPELSPRNCEFPTSSTSCRMLNEKQNVLYFFCGVEPSREYPANLVGTLINQLLSHQPENFKLQAAAMHLASAAESREGPEAIALTRLLVDCTSIVGRI